MNITEQTIITFDLTVEEEKALLITYDILLEISHEYNKYKTLSNFNTGEIIEIDELQRIKGIINAILEEGGAWELKRG